MPNSRIDALDNQSGLRRLAKRRQLHQIIMRHWLERVPGFPPCREPADYDKRVKSSFPQQVRHPGAGRFAHSSTVEINVLIFGQLFNIL